MAALVDLAKVVYNIQVILNEELDTSFEAWITLSLQNGDIIELI